MITNYNRQPDYDSKIKPVLTELMLLCSELSIPAFISLAVQNDMDKTIYVNDMISAPNLGITLKENKFFDYVNILNGFITVPEQRDFSIHFDTVPITQQGALDEAVDISQQNQKNT